VRVVNRNRLSYFSNDRSWYHAPISLTRFRGHHSRWKLIRRGGRWSRRHCLLSTLTGCTLSSYPIWGSCITHVQIWANWTYFRAYITRLFRNSLRSILRSHKICRIRTISRSATEWIRYFELVENDPHSDVWWMCLNKGRKDEDLL